MSKRRWVYAYADGRVIDRPVKLVYACTCSNRTNSAYCNFHDGMGTGDPVLLNISSNVNAFEEFNPPQPMPFQAGIYVDITTVGVVSMLIEEYDDVEYPA